jgi:hypothetical protein
MNKSMMIAVVVILSIIGFICGLALGVYEGNQPVNGNTQPQTYQIRTEAA